MNWTYKGTCWKFGHDLHIDGEIMPLRFVRERETRPEVLAQHVMEGIDPEFPKKVKPGDILVAGRRFAQGNPHAQGFRGIKALGLGLVTDWLPRGAYRNCVLAGVPAIPNCPSILDYVNQGDILEVNFETGLIRNLNTGKQVTGKPMPPFLLEMIAAGGSTLYLQQQLRAKGIL
jgi:3-isopropylmalate/(R)-2-methylmalate dehydratase small subunit